MAGRVEGKVALITGAAEGIGAASARALGAEGAKLVLTDINDNGVKSLAAELERDGAAAIGLRHDVSDEAGWESVMAATLSRFGRLDVLVNNAGIAFVGPTAETSLADWRRMLAVNLDGVFLGTKYAIRAMAGEGGSIINVSSILGIDGAATAAAYCASKGGVRLFTKSVALECGEAGNGIRVNSIHPGYIHTSMFDSDVAAFGSLEAKMKKVSALHPIGRIGQPAEIAAGVVFLASDESSFMTGSELVIDGGYTAR
ncbi:MAG: glucose 1-dehydrogenase [Alphaproteobacteria bacterium]|nr:glucose 1-dehydrogenase [Alphaproteobacteria bacterium]